MKRSLSYALWFVFLQLIFLSSSLAFHMADYWPIKAGNMWIFNNEIMACSSDTQTFGQYNARKFLRGADFCRYFCGNHVYVHLGSEGLLAVGIYEDGITVDLSATPFKFFPGEMQIGQAVTSSIPAGVLESHQISLTATLLGEETITVPAGTFTDTLVLEFIMDDSPTSEYREKIWLAKGVGPVKIVRVNENPVNHDGCLFTCGSFNLDTDIIVQREIELEDFIGQRKNVVVIPLF